MRRSCVILSLVTVAVTLTPNRAAARVELPSKALVTWVFANSSAYLDGCEYPYGTFAHADAVQNAYILISQGADAGISAFIIDTFNNKAGEVTGFYAEAARQWNDAHPSKRVCVSPLVEDNTATHVVDQFQKADAPTPAESAFCTHDGYPIFASWKADATYSWGTAIPKAIHDAGLGQIAYWPYFHYLNSSVYDGMRSYLDDFKSAGAAEIGVLQFGSGAAGSDQAMLALKPHADADGVLVVPAIATSRAVSCGDDACHGSRGASYFVDMKGFEVLLRHWQACISGYNQVGSSTIQYCNVGLGFAGDLGEDAYHDPAQFCDPWDAMNRNLGICSNIPDYKRAARPTNFNKSFRVNKWTHRGFYRIDQDYAQWFLTGEKPAAAKEYVAFAYRQHPLLISAPNGDLCPQGEVSIRLSNSQDGTFWGDRIYVTSNLSSPAELRVTLGGTTNTIQLAPGMIWSTDPNARQDWSTEYSVSRTGRPSFELRRGGVVIASWEGALTITTNPQQDATTVTRNTGIYADYYELASSGEDGGIPDSGVLEAGVTDAGVTDAGALEAGVPKDSGLPDGQPDVALSEAGTLDGASPGADERSERRTEGGCTCTVGVWIGPPISGAGLLVAGLLLLARRWASSNERRGRDAGRASCARNTGG